MIVDHCLHSLKTPLARCPAKQLPACRPQAPESDHAAQGNKVLIKPDGGPPWSPGSGGGTSEGVPVTFSCSAFSCLCARYWGPQMRVYSGTWERKPAGVTS